MQDKHGLLTAPISVVLRQMTVPTVFGMIAVLMFNLVDTFFISLLGTQALAAISFTFPVTFGVNCITMGIGVGLSTCLGHLLGEGKERHAARVTSHGLLLALTLVIIASAFGLMILEPFFTLIGAKPDLLPLIKQYMQVWFLVVPLLVVPMAGNSAIRATGDTRTPAKIMMLSGILNGLFDPLLIFGYGPFPELGIRGAAIASGLSWICALGGSLYLLNSREKLLAMPELRTLFQDWWQIMKIGTPAGLSTAMNPISAAILMRILSVHGTAAVAAYGAAQRVESVLLLVMISLTSALTPFMAQNLGARKPVRSFKGMFLSMRFAILFQLLVFIMMVPLSIPLAALFSNDPAVKDLIWLYLVIVPSCYGFQGVVMLLVSGLNAMHLPLAAFFWSFMRLFIFTLPFAAIGSAFYSVQGLFIGIVAGNITGGVLAYLYGLKIRRKALAPVG
jgi:putative MATE family efflux protein